MNRKQRITNCVSKTRPSTMNRFGKPDLGISRRDGRAESNEPGVDQNQSATEGTEPGYHPQLRAVVREGAAPVC